MQGRYSRNEGFTMIELITVIVILGILSAVALPQFIELRTDAVKVSTQAMEGVLRTAAGNIRAKCAVAPTCSLTSGTTFVTINGTNFQIWNGWVDAGDNIGVSEIDKAITYSGFNLTISPQSHRFTHAKAKDPATCYAEYKESTTPGGQPQYVTVVSGC